MSQQSQFVQSALTIAFFALACSLIALSLQSRVVKTSFPNRESFILGQSLPKIL